MPASPAREAFSFSLTLSWEVYNCRSCTGFGPSWPNVFGADGAGFQFCTTKETANRWSAVCCFSRVTEHFPGDRGRGAYSSAVTRSTTWPGLNDVTVTQPVGRAGRRPVGRQRDGSGTTSLAPLAVAVGSRRERRGPVRPTRRHFVYADASWLSPL